MDPEKTMKTFLNEAEACEFCNVSKTTFRRAVNLGRIPYCIFPGSTKKLFHRETIEKVVKSNRRKGLVPDDFIRP
ncbi:MAG: helix-turn-helix domain-containing protein [PVC group bacterium]